MERPSFSRPEDPNLCKDNFFQKAAFSWVGKECLLAIDHQGTCICCWAFSGAEAITAAYAIKNKEVIPLSKQQLLDCTPNYYNVRSLKSEEKKTSVCYAVHYNLVYEFAKDYGIVEESAYKYKEMRGDCVHPTARTVFIDGYEKVPSSTTKEGIEELIRKQPITCAIPFVASLQAHVGEGIYMGSSESLDMLEKGENHLLKHAMLIVGYGKEGEEEYYLVKNSWGEAWGYKGYAKVKRSLVSSLSYPKINY